MLEIIMDKKQGRPITKVILNESDRQELEKRANSYTAQVMDSLRARSVAFLHRNQSQALLR